MTREEAIKQSLEYFNGDELAATVFVDKYALRDEDGNVMEATPDELHERLATEFARIEAKYPNPLSKEEIFESLKNFEKIVPQGSPMAGIGNPSQIMSVSNCFVVDSPEDSYGGIMKADEELAQLMKRRAGVGLDISTIRPKGMKTKNAAKTTDGIGVFMERFSNTCREVAQGGRRGALLISISVHHPEVSTFIKIKNDKTKVTGANISVKLTSEFMKAVKNNTTYEQRWPVDSKSPSIIKTVNAKEIWDSIIENAWASAEPGLLFWDNVEKNTPSEAYEEFKAISTNPCQPKWAKVLTRNGIRTFEDISEGDEIWSSEGWTTVVKKWVTGIKDVYSYKTTVGTFYGTENHRVLSNGVKVEVKDAKTIDKLVGEVLVDITHNPQDVMDGIMFGDGSNNHGKLYLCIGGKDGDYFDSEISHLITEHLPKIKSYAYKVNSTITSDELPLTYLRKIPERFVKGDKNKVCGFLRGLFTANGSMNSDRVCLKATSYKVVEDVSVMLSSLGISNFINTNKEKKTKFSNGEYIVRENYAINITSDRDLFYKHIGFIQKYKMDTLKKIIDTKNSRNFVKKAYDVKKVEYVSTEEVFDITVDNNSHTYWSAGLNVSNCGEIVLPKYDSCRLVSMNVLGFVKNSYTSDAYFDYKEFSKYVKMAQRYMDDIVDIELEQIDKVLNKIDNDGESDDTKLKEKNLWLKIKNTCSKCRRTGLGVTAIGDALAALGVVYGSKESVEVVESIYKTLEISAYESSIEMAKDRGAFPVYEYQKETTNNFITRIIDNVSDNHKEMYRNYGRRNIALTTTAPAGSVSILTQTSSGIEPVFRLSYKRRKKINPMENIEPDYVDSVGDKWRTFEVYHHQFKKWMEITGETDETKSPWFGGTANDVDWVSSVDLQAAAQKWICHSISKTCNLPNSATKEMVADVYMRAWESGCKGFTVYRDGCRDGVLISNESEKETKESFVEHNAPKRPESLECDIHQVKIKGEAWTIFVGLMDGKPYEIMGGKSSFVNISKKIVKGKLVKNSKKAGSSKSIYDLHYGDEDAPTIIKDVVRTFENPTEGEFSRMVSLALRHGSPVQYVVEQLQKDEEGDLYSFSKVLSRVLKTYIKDGVKIKAKCKNCGSDKLIYQEGCLLCSDCGFSKC
jgi:ribonucleoside-diphosphate reductase alpha chain